MSDKNSTIFLDERVPTSAKVGFGFANAGVGLLSGIINGALSAFYNTKFGLEEGKIIIAMAIFAVWNAINDPLFGILEDRTPPNKLGRRVPYIRYGAPVFGLLFFLSWFPFLQNIFNANAEMVQWALFANFLIMLFLLDTIFTIVGLVTYELPSEMCITAKGRANVQMYAVYFGAIGMLGSMLIPMFFLTEDTSFTVLYISMGITALVGTLMLFISSFFLVENEYAMHEEKLGFWDSIKMCFTNRTFLIFEFASFFYQIAWVTITGLVSYYIKWQLGLTGIASFIPIMAIFVMVFAFTYPAGWLIRKWGIKKTYMVGIASAIPVLVILFFVSQFTIVSIIVLGVYGALFAAVSLANSPLMFEIIDKDELRTGKRRETTFAGMNALFVKPAISVANIVFFAIIGAFGFDENNTLFQTTDAVFGIKLATTLVPAAALLITLVIIAFYDLHGPEWEAEKAKLSLIHIEKERAYIEKLAKEGKVSPTYSKLRRE